MKTNNKPKKHHVTPSSYLNNFADLRPGQRSPRISVLRRSTGSIEHSVRTKDIVYRNFYDHLGSDGILYSSAEERLNKTIEAPGDIVLQAIIGGNRLGWKQIIHLARYTLMSIFRSLWFHLGLRAVLVPHSTRHRYPKSRIPEIAHRKQVELLRALMGFPTDSPNVYKDDPILSRIFNSRGSLTVENSQILTMKVFAGMYFSKREITICSTPSGSELITGDNFVVPLLDKEIDNFLSIPFHISTRLLMPISPTLLLHLSSAERAYSGSAVSKSVMSKKEVDSINNAMCEFSSAHIFSSNIELLKQVHNRTPHHGKKIVVVDGKKAATVPYPTDLPQTFNS